MRRRRDQLDTARGSVFHPVVVEFETGQCIVRDYRWEYQRAGERVISRDRHRDDQRYRWLQHRHQRRPVPHTDPRHVHRYRILAQRHHRRSDPATDSGNGSSPDRIYGRRVQARSVRRYSDDQLLGAVHNQQSGDYVYGELA